MKGKNFIKQQIGGLSFILRKNKYLKGDKDIKEFKITDKGIEYYGNIKKLKQKMIIPYSHITNIEFVKPHTVYVDVNKKPYIFDTEPPCKKINLKNIHYCSGIIDFYKILNKKWEEYLERKIIHSGGLKSRKKQKRRRKTKKTSCKCRK